MNLRRRLELSPMETFYMVVLNIRVDVVITRYSQFCCKVTYAFLKVTIAKLCNEKTTRLTRKVWGESQGQSTQKLHK